MISNVCIVSYHVSAGQHHGYNLEVDNTNEDAMGMRTKYLHGRPQA